MRKLERTSQLAHPRGILEPKMVDRCEMSIIMYPRARTCETLTHVRIRRTQRDIESSLVVVRVSAPFFLPAFAKRTLSPRETAICVQK